jgi:adenine-specific DNA-methyltransferase
MDKMKMESPDLTKNNIERIEQLFPNAITEIQDEDGKLVKGVNFEVLKQELSPELVDGQECYEFTWVGKKESILEANKPIRKTLRPCVEESKDWENTENLYIEGDNLEVLKLLQESYLNKVKMIYIDPPYNTGNDFVYKDDFRMGIQEYEEESGTFDEVGNRLRRNTETNGRFHSDWCSMMYSRLKLAKNLLKEDGVIFISIDDNEVANLRKIGDEIFGQSSFIANIIWEKKYTRTNDAKCFSDNHDHILMFSKNKEVFSINRLPRTQDQDKAYKNPDNDNRGPWKSTPLQAKSGNNLNFIHQFPNGITWQPPTGRYSAYSHERLDEFFNNGGSFINRK